MLRRLRGRLPFWSDRLIPRRRLRPAAPALLFAVRGTLPRLLFLVPQRTTLRPRLALRRGELQGRTELRVAGLFHFHSSRKRRRIQSRARLLRPCRLVPLATAPLCRDLSAAS